jgi:hypothetical protein
MSDGSLFDEAALVLAMPIPRRKALKHLAVVFGGSVLSVLWPTRATATGFACANCAGCFSGICFGKKVGDPCQIGVRRGHCETKIKCNSGKCCTCVLGPAPAAPEVGSIPDVSITREDSLAAGNCQDGTNWVSSWFPGRDSVSAREAAAAAIARGEPSVAREIARTAHLLHRGAVRNAADV